MESPLPSETSADSRRASRLLWTSLLAVALAGAVWVLLRSSPGDTARPTTSRRPAPTDSPVLRGAGHAEIGPDASAPPPPSLAEDHVALRGRVVGQDYAPGAGVVVRMRSSDRAEQTVRTDATGHFLFDFGKRPSARVQVAIVAGGSREGAGGVSVQVDPEGPKRIDVGTIVLRAGLDLAVRVFHDEQPVEGARVFATSIPLVQARAQRYGGYEGRPWSGWSHGATSDATGLAVLQGIASGAVRILAVAEGPLRGEVQIRTDRYAAPVEVDLAQARDLRVEVVRAGDGAPVPGCFIGATGQRRQLEEPWPRAVTDVDGVAILKNAPREEIELHIAGPDWSSAFLKMPRQVPADVTVFRTEVPVPTRILVPVEAHDGPLPADGTRVALEQSSWAWWPGTRCYLAREGIIQDGHLVMERYATHGSVRTRARLPDGRTGHIHMRMPDELAGVWRAEDAVVFRASRTVELHITERQTGRPAAGVSVTLRAPEGGAPRSGPVQLGPVRTDEEGRARIEGAPATMGTINLCSNPDWVPEYRQHVFAPQTTVDLTKGDVSLELQVESIVEVVVGVRVEGRPGLPPEMHTLLFSWPQGVDGVRPGGLQLDPVRGELRFRARLPLTEPQPPLRPGGGPERLHLLLTSRDHATETVQLAYDPASGTLVGDVDFVRAGTLVTRVHAPPEGRYDFQLEAHDGSDWVEVETPPLVPVLGEADEERYEGLRPGRYRLTEKYAGESSPEVQVHGGSEPTVLTWILGPAVYAEGTVILPAGVDPSELEVWAWTDTDPPKPAGSATMQGTHFKIRIPPQGRCRLHPFHPRCDAADEEGVIVVSGPQQGLRLRMVLR